MTVTRSTLAPDMRDRWNHRRTVSCRVAGPASYATGGDTVTPADFGLGTVEAILFSGMPSDGSAIRVVQFSSATGKVLWFVPNTGSEVGNGTNLSTFIADAVVVGH